MVTESHSALFGLKPQSKPTQNAGSGPGSGIEGTSGVAGFKNSTTGLASTAHRSTTIEAVEQPGSGHGKAAAGSSIVQPSQGSNKNNDAAGGLLNKLNPLK